jgi:hypothetical protein
MIGGMTVDQKLNDFATRCFRDIADGDYTAARMCYRARLISQFQWAGQQALEKYLKGILLFNRVKARNVRHSLETALQHTAKLPFNVQLSEHTLRTIDYFGTYGPHRYLEYSSIIGGPKLVLLDEAVWELRRYCTVPREREAIEAAGPNAKRYQLRGGVLEQIVASRDHPARKALLWQNRRFGRRARKKVRMVTPFVATNAPLTLHPEILDEILKYVFLPRDVVKAYREELARRLRKRETPPRGDRPAMWRSP